MRGAFRVAVVETSVFGALGYYARCLEADCAWRSKCVDHEAQAAAFARAHGAAHARRFDRIVEAEREG